MEQIKVLVIDDDPDVLETLQAVLSNRGFNVATTVREDELKNKIIDFAPNVILLDVALKNLHGGELCKEIKNSGLAKDISVILFSGDRSIRENYKIYLADNYIEKPVKINTLVAALKQSGIKVIQ